MGVGVLTGFKIRYFLFFEKEIEGCVLGFLNK